MVGIVYYNGSLIKMLLICSFNTFCESDDTPEMENNVKNEKLDWTKGKWYAWHFLQCSTHKRIYSNILRVRILY